MRPPTDIHIIEVQHNLIELEWKKVQPESRYRIDVENIVLHSLSTFYTEKGTLERPLKKTRNKVYFKYFLKICTLLLVTGKVYDLESGAQSIRSFD